MCMASGITVNGPSRSWVVSRVVIGISVDETLDADSISVIQNINVV